MKQSVISIISPAGGVGKSTISKELACIFGATRIDGKPLSVCLVDGNLMFGCQRALFRVSYTQHDLSTWLSDHRKLVGTMDYGSIEELYTWSYMEKYISRINEHNVYLITAPEKCRGGLDMTSSEANTLIRTLKRLFDVIIIDTANDLSSLTVSAIELSSKALFVINDDQRSLTKMLALRQTLIRQKMIESVSGKAEIIFNKYSQNRNQRFADPATVEDILQFPVVSVIPYFADSIYYNNRSKSLALSNTSLSDPLLKLARHIIPEVNTSSMRAPFIVRFFTKNRKKSIKLCD